MSKMSLRDEVLLRVSNDPHCTPDECFTPIPKGHRGSTYGACTIRVNGDARFVAQALRLLEPMIKTQGVQIIALPVKGNGGKPYPKLTDGDPISVIVRRRGGGEPKAPKLRPNRRRQATPTIETIEVVDGGQITHREVEDGDNLQPEDELEDESIDSIDAAIDAAASEAAEVVDQVIGVLDID